MSKLKNNKSLGQHWLKDREILDEIAELSVPIFNELGRELPLCLEIGPGLGTLTSSLLRIYPKVLAVEFDRRLAENLPKSFPGKNLEVVNADFLQFNLDELPEYVVCANIPYYITSPIITKLIEAKNAPKKIVLLVQKEVAERVVAGAEDASRAGCYPGTQTVLSLSVQNRAKVTLGPVVEKEYFTPPPKVDSQVLILEPHTPIVSEETFELISVGFIGPRKKLMKNLAGKTVEISGRKVVLQKDKLSEVFAELGISLDARPGDLGLKKWGELANRLK